MERLRNLNKMLNITNDVEVIAKECNTTIQKIQSEVFTKALRKEIDLTKASIILKDSPLKDFINKEYPKGLSKPLPIAKGRVETTR